MSTWTDRKALKQVLQITADVFQGPVSTKESIDPEAPSERYIVVVPEVEGDSAKILALEAEWRRRIMAAFPHDVPVRLAATRKK